MRRAPKLLFTALLTPLLVPLLLAGAAGALLAGPRFIRGDCNADGDAGCSVTDPVFLLLHLFAGSGVEPPCLEACDANDDARLDISDAVYMLSHCFLGGPAPPPPYPDCGSDSKPGLPCGAFLPCAGDCAPQDARGVGACDLIVGIFWDGFRCRYESGCSCEGTDCASSFDSIETCYEEHSGCESACDPMDARGVGPCRQILGYAWNGRQCRLLGGCECEGADCDRLYAAENECLAAVSGCPPLCTPMDVHEVGTCEPVHGWFWDGENCRPLSGCECGGTDCDKLFASPDECEAAHAPCR